jgi:hypothetical protein
MPRNLLLLSSRNLAYGSSLPGSSPSCDKIVDLLYAVTETAPYDVASIGGRRP